MVKLIIIIIISPLSNPPWFGGRFQMLYFNGICKVIWLFSLPYVSPSLPITVFFIPPPFSVLNCISESVLALGFSIIDVVHLTANSATPAPSEFPKLISYVETAFLRIFEEHSGINARSTSSTSHRSHRISLLPVFQTITFGERRIPGLLR